MRNVARPQKCETCLKANSIFKHLNQKELELLNSVKGINSYKKGNIIYHEGNRINGFYCVNKGIVKIFKTGFDGKEQIIRFAKPGHIIGYRSILSAESACTSAKVMEDSQLCFIPGETLVDLVKSNGEFSIALMRLTCSELGEANSFITDIAQKTVRERLAEVILSIQDDFGTDEKGFLGISLTREELSNMIGTATESVIRLLSEFKNDKLVEIQGRKIKVIDQTALQKVANLY